jgi:hypothetical protein
MIVHRSGGRVRRGRDPEFAARSTQTSLLMVLHGIAASVAVAFKEAVVVIRPGRDSNMLGRSINFPRSRLAVAVAIRGAKRGANERRYQAAAGDEQRLKLLVGPHPATLRNDKDLYGMQKVRGSNPLSSTIFRALVRVEVTIK